MATCSPFSNWLANDCDPDTKRDALRDYVRCILGIDECQFMMETIVKYARLFPKAGTDEVLAMVMEDNRDDTNVVNDLITEYEQGRV